MKTCLLSLFAVFAASGLWGKDSPSLTFADKIVAPPLSLSDSIKEGQTAKPMQFSSGASRLSGAPASLLTREGPTLADAQAAAAARKPHLARDSRMPIVEPNSAVDYKM